MTVITDHMHFPMFGNSLLDVLCCKGDYFKVCFIGFLILKKKRPRGFSGVTCLILIFQTLEFCWGSLVLLRALKISIQVLGNFYSFIQETDIEF